MAQVLDFNKRKKHYLTIVLPDENQTKLLLMTPTKKLITALMTMLPESAEIPSEEDLAVLYELCAQLISRNKSGRKVTAEELEELLEFEGMIVFFKAYTDFVTELSNEKN